jgi:hypothetical protein
MAIVGIVFALAIFFFTIGLRLFCFAVIVGFKLLGLILRFLAWSIKALIYLFSRGKYGSVSIKAFEDEEEENQNNSVLNTSSNTSSSEYTVKEDDWKNTKQKEDNNSDVIHMRDPFEYAQTEEFKNRIKYHRIMEKYGCEKGEDILTRLETAQTDEEKEDLEFALKEYNAYQAWYRDILFHPSRHNFVRKYD